MDDKNLDKDVVGILKLRLRYLAKRCETLAERLEEVRELGAQYDYSGYRNGRDSLIWTLEEYLGEHSDALYAVVSERYGKDTYEYDVGYHMENVNYVIHDYFTSVINGQARPDDGTLDLYVREVRMTKDALLRIADEL